MTLTLLPTGGGGFLSHTTRMLVEKSLAKSIFQGVVTVIFQARGHEKLDT